MASVKIPHLFYLSIACISGSVLHAELDLTSLYDYAGQAIPSYINRDNTAGNPITNEGATLGRVLFYDKRLSNNNTISCSSCHIQEHAFSDTATASTGVAGTTGRHSMRLINARFAAEDNFFWDERADTLEIQTTQPIQDHVEMGFSGTLGDPDFSDLVNNLSLIDDYQVLFTQVYGDATITDERIQQAIAQFVRSIQSFDSRYDIGRAQVANNGQNFPNFTTAENAGKQLFMTPANQGGAGCAGCHRPPEFDIDPNSGNNGHISAIGGGTDTTVTRSPSLRDLVDTNGDPNGGFMHDGALISLAEVVAHYNAIPVPRDTVGLDQRLTGPPNPQNNAQRLNLTAGEQDNLIAFMETLTGSDVYTNPIWSDPFDNNGNLTLVLVKTSDTPITTEFVPTGQCTLHHHGVPGMDYTFQYSDDLSEWHDIGTVTCAGDGTLEASYATGSNGRRYYRFVYP